MDSIYVLLVRRNSIYDLRSGEKLRFYSVFNDLPRLRKVDVVRAFTRFLCYGCVELLIHEMESHLVVSRIAFRQDPFSD